MSKQEDRARRTRCWAWAVAGLAVCSLFATPAGAEPSQRVVPGTRAGQGYYLDPRGARVAFEPMYQGWFGSQRYETYR